MWEKVKHFELLPRHKCQQRSTSHFVDVYLAHGTGALPGTFAVHSNSSSMALSYFSRLLTVVSTSRAVYHYIDCRVDFPRLGNTTDLSLRIAATHEYVTCVVFRKGTEMVICFGGV